MDVEAREENFELNKETSAGILSTNNLMRVLYDTFTAKGQMTNVY